MFAIGLFMQKLIYTFFSFCFLGTIIAQNEWLPEDLGKPVGTTINVYEKNRYELLPFINDVGFKSAQIEKRSDSTFYLHILYRNHTKETILYSSRDLLLLKDKIAFQDNKLAEVRKRRTDYLFTRFHIHTGIGRPMRLRGNMDEVYRKKYPMGNQGSFFQDAFGGNAVSHNESNRLNFGISFNISPSLSLGFWKLPNDHKCYGGGNGTNITYSGWLFDNTDYGIGTRVDEEILSTAWMLSADYKFLPRKQLYFIGLDLSGGLNLYLNKLDIKTTLWAYDIGTVYDSITNTYSSKAFSAQQNYAQENNLFGLMLHLNVNLFIGDYFSIFYQASYGESQTADISEKKLTFMSQTAVAPRHYEYLGGLGQTLGLTVHMFNGKKKEFIKRMKNKPLI